MCRAGYVLAAGIDRAQYRRDTRPISEDASIRIHMLLNVTRKRNQKGEAGNPPTVLVIGKCCLLPAQGGILPFRETGTATGDMAEDHRRTGVRSRH